MRINPLYPGAQGWLIPGIAYLFGVMVLGTAWSTGAGQAMAVQPVTLQLAPHQRAATLTVTNRGTTEMAIQLRAFSWSQAEGDDQLVPSDDIVVSPPLATIAPGASQLVRLIVRHPPEEREITYRILLDQIPPPAAPGLVRLMLRLSIPIFSPPATLAAPQVQFHLESKNNQLWLVGMNNGFRHERFTEIELLTGQGLKLRPVQGESPYILSGVTRRWAMRADGTAPPLAGPFSLTARGENGAIHQQVSVASLP